MFAEFRGLELFLGVFLGGGVNFAFVRCLESVEEGNLIGCVGGVLLCRGEGVDIWFIVEGKGSEWKGKARLSLDWVER